MRKMKLPSYTDDPVRDWDSYCECQDALHDMLPMCDECGERVEDEYYYDIGGTIICEECLNHNYRKHTADWME